MAVINRYSLVLNGVNVVRDVVAGTMDLSGSLAYNQLPAMPFSVRPPSQRAPQAEQETGLRHDHARDDMDDAADRAGRPGCLSILAGSCPSYAWRLSRFTGRPHASVGKTLAERLMTERVFGLGTSGRLGWLRAKQAKKPAKVAAIGIKPIAGAFSASTRG
jgi:hypothetical protein